MRPAGDEQRLRALVSWLNRAQAAQDHDRTDEAIVCYDRALAIKPDSLLALNGKGSLLGRLKQYEKALPCLDRAIAANPNIFATHFNRALALQNLKKLDEALAGYDAALGLRPDHLEAATNRGIVLHTLDRLEEALAAFDNCLARDPDNAKLLDARGSVLAGLNRWEEALLCYEKAIELDPACVMARSNRAVLLLKNGKREEALKAFDSVIESAPDHPPAHLHRSFILLRDGDLQRGWEEYEWRRAGSKGQERPTFAGCYWLGKEDLRGKSILVFSEQGFGDTLQFCRYIEMLLSRGADVVFRVPPQLKALLGCLRGARIVGADETPPQTDFHCALLSLPYAFATDLGTIPDRVPYLKAPPELVEQWRKRLAYVGRQFKVGIAWHGMHRKPFGEPERSVPLHNFHQLARVPGVRLISLQKGDGVEELLDVPGDVRVETLGEEFDSGPDAFLDTAAVMMHLDLVVTVDTSLAHLAGSLARPTWIALKHLADWRWLLDRSDSPWYPSVRLFRQRSLGDWNGVFESIADALRTHANTVPASKA
jgi:tetratricopeptide (TPR) repeat protein